MLEIDGSYHEGGGQIVRTSVALSALTGTPVRITNIRAKRCNPGLAAQHLAGILALAKICDAKLSGAEVGSTGLEFFPGKIKGGEYKIDVGTAGAIPLVLQALVLPAVHAKEDVALEISGGTDVLWGPTASYFQHIFCHYMEKIGIAIFAETLRHGFYPKGGGKVRAILKPCRSFKSLFMEKRAVLDGLEIVSIASESLRGAKVAERQVDGAKSVLKYFGRTTVSYVPALSSGSSVYVHAKYGACRLGATSIGERGKPAEAVGEEAATVLKKQVASGACLDEWMADQILPYLALSGGKVSVAKVTPHARTNIWVIERFFGNVFDVDEKAGTVAVPRPIETTMQ